MSGKICHILERGFLNIVVFFLCRQSRHYIHEILWNWNSSKGKWRWRRWRCWSLQNCACRNWSGTVQRYGNFWCNINLLLTEREGRTGEYWPEVVTVRTEGQYSPVRLELARLVSSLLYGTRAMLVLNLRAFEKKKIRSIWPFPRKRSVWRNPDQERTNQNARICRAI